MYMQNFIELRQLELWKKWGEMADDEDDDGDDGERIWKPKTAIFKVS